MAIAVKDPIRSGFFAETGIQRMAAITAIVIMALVVQSTLLVKTTVLGVIPQLTLVVVVSLAYLDGERVGVATGFMSGLLQDLLLPQSIVGLTALVYTLVGFSVGNLRQYAPQQSVWAPVGAVAAASAAAEAGYALLAIMFGEPWVSISFTLRVVGLVVLYNTLLMPFAFPLLRRIADRFRPEKVHRW
ncbi:MAG TPA: rod shape-determining protein MreD [Actinomycetota bacterium]|nr:rod shape-determining protein MreD [Actinomycetota bacterium]